MHVACILITLFEYIQVFELVCGSNIFYFQSVFSLSKGNEKKSKCLRARQTNCYYRYNSINIQTHRCTLHDTKIKFSSHRTQSLELIHEVRHPNKSFYFHSKNPLIHELKRVACFNSINARRVELLLFINYLRMLSKCIDLSFQWQHNFGSLSVDFIFQAIFIFIR